MRFRIALGVFLILAAIALLLVLVILPILPGANDNRDVLKFFASILCEPGERAEIEVIVTRDSDGTGYTPYTTCVGREGERTDASGKHLVIAMAAFTMPFLIGLFMVILNANALQREWRENAWRPDRDSTRNARVGFPQVKVVHGASPEMFAASPQVEMKDGVLKVDGIEIRMDGIDPERVKMFQGTSSVMMGGAQTGTSSLAERLKEIQEALNAGLISQDEYDRLRQEILDKLV
jgi:hypothetical protein